MSRLKCTLITVFIVIMSFFIASSPPPSQRIERDVDIFLNIPDRHNIRIIILGQGLVSIDNINKNSGDIVSYERFSNASFVLTPHETHTIDKVTFNDDDITSTLSSNTVTLSNVHEDGTLTVYFKSKPLPIDKKISPVKSLERITDNADKYISEYFPNFQEYVATGDTYVLTILIILLISLLILTYCLRYKI